MFRDVDIVTGDFLRNWLECLMKDLHANSVRLALSLGLSVVTSVCMKTLTSLKWEKSISVFANSKLYLENWIKSQITESCKFISQAYLKYPLVWMRRSLWQEKFWSPTDILTSDGVIRNIASTSWWRYAVAASLQLSSMAVDFLTSMMMCILCPSIWKMSIISTQIITKRSWAGRKDSEA